MQHLQQRVPSVSPQQHRPFIEAEIDRFLMSGLLPQPGDEQDASSDSETSSGVSTSSEEEDVVTGGQAAPPKQRRASQSKQKRKTKKDRGRKGKSSKKILKEKAASVQWPGRSGPREESDVSLGERLAQQQAQQEALEREQAAAQARLSAPTSSRTGRQRKPVERFDASSSSSAGGSSGGGGSQQRILALLKGPTLSQIPNVHAYMTKCTGKDRVLKDLHGILFGKPGTVSQAKRNIGAFSGFLFADEEDKRIVQHRIELVKTLEQLRNVAKILDLSPSGSRSEVEERLLQFVANPEPSGHGVYSIKLSKEGQKGKSKKSSGTKRSANPTASQESMPQAGVEEPSSKRAKVSTGSEQE